MNSNRSSNQGQRKANGKNRANKNQKRKPRKTADSGSMEQKSAAAAYATGQKTGGPSITRTGVNSCRIVHRELIASVTGSVAFAVQQSFPINPGMATTFPWLANEALGWERYKFNKLKFCYYTRTGTGTPGSVLLAPDYDAADSPPVSEQAASSYMDCVEDAPWKDMKCTLRPRDLNGPNAERYVRSGALAANQDIKTYDAGDLHLCTIDGTAVAWGKLWVEYDVTLYTPQVPAGGFPAVGQLNAAGGTIAAATPFGAVPVSSGQFSMGGAATNVLSFSGLVVGQSYDVEAFLTGTVLNATTACSFGTPVGGTQTLTRSNMVNAAQTNGACKTVFTATSPNGSLVLTVNATTVTAATVFMSSVPLGSADLS